MSAGGFRENEEFRPVWCRQAGCGEEFFTVEAGVRDEAGRGTQQDPVFPQSVGPRSRMLRCVTQQSSLLCQHFRHSGRKTLEWLLLKAPVQTALHQPWILNFFKSSSVSLFHIFIFPYSMS